MPTFPWVIMSTIMASSLRVVMGVEKIAVDKDSMPSEATASGPCCAALYNTTAPACRLSMGVPKRSGKMISTLAVPVGGLSR